MKYVTSVKHTESSVLKLCTVQYKTYNRRTKYTIMGIGVAAIFGSVFLGFNSSMGMLCLLIGCWALASVNFPPRNMAKKICEQQKEHMPWANYEINEDGIWVTSGNGTWMVGYDEVYSLIEDKENFYVFLNPNSMHMLPKAAIEDGTPDGLKLFLEKKTGKEFGPVGGSLRLQKNLFYFIKQAQKKKAENSAESAGESPEAEE